MEIYTTAKARSNLFKIVKDVQEDEEVVWVLGKDFKAVIISEKNYESMLDAIQIYSRFCHSSIDEEMKDISKLKEYIPEENDNV